MFEKVLLAVDESNPSARAISATTALAKRFGSEVIVFGMPDHPDRPAFGTEPSGSAASMVDRVVMDLKDCGVSARPELWAAPTDIVATFIADICRHESVDLIVMGAPDPWGHGESVVGDAGEILSNRVLRLTGRPVLAVP